MQQKTGFETSIASGNADHVRRRIVPLVSSSGARATGRATPSDRANRDRRDERAGPADGRGSLSPSPGYVIERYTATTRAESFSRPGPAIARSILGLRSDPSRRVASLRPLRGFGLDGILDAAADRLLRDGRLIAVVFVGVHRSVGGGCARRAPPESTASQIPVPKRVRTMV